MAVHVQEPTLIAAAGQPPKSIEEFVGRVNSDTTAVSIARMKSPPGWSEPGQTPEFDEHTVVLRGSLHVKLRDTAFDIGACRTTICKPSRAATIETVLAGPKATRSPSSARTARRCRCWMQGRRLEA